MSEALGQNVVVDNRPGASGIVGTEIGLKSPPDGYTILLVSNTISLNPAMFRKLPYDNERDMTPVSLLAATPYSLNVHPALPVRTTKELIAPANLPKDILAKLHSAIVSAMRAPEITRRLADDGSNAVASTPEEFRALIRSETAKWTKIVNTAGIALQ